MVKDTTEQVAASQDFQFDIKKLKQSAEVQQQQQQQHPASTQDPHSLKQDQPQQPAVPVTSKLEDDFNWKFFEQVSSCDNQLRRDELLQISCGLDINDRRQLLGQPEIILNGSCDETIRRSRLT